MAIAALDLDELDLGETEVLCEALGITDVGALGDVLEQGLSPKLVRVLVWIERSREDRSFTMEDAKRVKFSEAMAMFTDPNDAGAESASPSVSEATEGESSDDTSLPSAEPTATLPSSSIA